MKTIGLVGGLSWVSTVDYYRIINQRVNAVMGGGHSAKIILHSLDFAEFKARLDIQDWPAIAEMVTDAARELEKHGSDCLLICSNTPHKIADDVSAAISIPLIHVAEVTASDVLKRHVTTVGLLGTKFTMEEAFFREKLTSKGIRTVIPEPEDRQFIHTTIFSELTAGVFSVPTRTRYLKIIESLVLKGTGGVIMGCTEIPQLLSDAALTIPAFDTTQLHANAAVEFALEL